MSDLQWKEFLNDWNARILDKKKYFKEYFTDLEKMAPNVLVGASIETITQLEDKLKLKLPESYKAFLSASNGWRFILSYNKYLYSVEDVDWFAAKEPEWVEDECWDEVEISDDDYLRYDNNQNLLMYRKEYVRASLQISEPEDGEVFLLNPKVISNNGEWEAWRLRTGSGARRFPSFEDLMIEEKRESIQYVNQHKDS